MEIKTCEQYVLQQLHDAQEQIISLEMEVADLREDRKRMVDTDTLIERIKHHRDNVTCDTPQVNETYKLAHDHIIELIEMLVKE